MAIESFHIGCYWGPRPETIENCTGLILETLISLRSTDIASYQNWFEKGYSKKEALQKKVEIDYNYLWKILNKGKSKKFDNMGFLIGLWNGYEEGRSTGITFNCGSSFSKVPNSVVINLPFEGIEADNVLDIKTLKQISKIIIKIWNPDHLIVKSNLVSNKVSYNTQFLEIGWLTYFSTEYQKSNIESHPPFDEHLEGYGDFLIVTKDVFSSENPQHITTLQKYVDATEFRT